MTPGPPLRTGGVTGDARSQKVFMASSIDSMSVDRGVTRIITVPTTFRDRPGRCEGDRFDALSRTAMRRSCKPAPGRFATRTAVDPIDRPMGTGVERDEAGRVLVEAARNLPEPVVVALQRFARVIRIGGNR